MNILSEFDRAAAAVSGVVGAVRSGQFELPTACTEWSVRGVVRHVAQGNARAVACARGEPPPDPGPPGEDVAAFERSVAHLRAALHEPGLLERIVRTPLGEVPGAVLVAMRRNEFLVHAWDIADVPGRPPTSSPSSRSGRWRSGTRASGTRRGCREGCSGRRRWRHRV